VTAHLVGYALPAPVVPHGGTLPAASYGGTQGLMPRERLSISEEHVDWRPDRTAVTTQRIVRNTSMAQSVKQLYASRRAETRCVVKKLSTQDPNGSMVRRT